MILFRFLTRGEKLRTLMELEECIKDGSLDTGKSYLYTINGINKVSGAVVTQGCQGCGHENSDKDRDFGYITIRLSWLRSILLERRIKRLVDLGMYIDKNYDDARQFGYKSGVGVKYSIYFPVKNEVRYEESGGLLEPYTVCMEDRLEAILYAVRGNGLA